MKEKHLALFVWAVGPSWFLVHIWSQLYIHNDALAYTHSFLLMSLYHRGRAPVEDRFHQSLLGIKCNKAHLDDSQFTADRLLLDEQPADLSLTDPVQLLRSSLR
jgi:hypothetical protein